jgi:polyhydroxybutyrate depolymerase
MGAPSQYVGTMRLSFWAGTSALLLVAVFACSGESTPSPGASNGTPSGSSGGDGDTPPANGGSSGSSGTTPTPDGNAPETFVTVTNETMEFDGTTRTYVLAKPVDYDASKTYPLVIAFHGNPGLATGMAQNLPFDPASKKEAVIVYPQAASDSWDLYTPTQYNADMYFIEALPAEIKAHKANIDESLVFGFGYSGGGFFLTQFTCRFGGVFKAISINAGGGPDEQQMGYDQYENGCYVCPGGPIATLVTHGENDGEVTWDSGDFTRKCYATTNGCGESLSAITPAPCETYDGCPTGKPVEWCLIPGLGHGVWSNAVEESWKFFKSIP